jgi:hypothetical protein
VNAGNGLVLLSRRVFRLGLAVTFGRCLGRIGLLGFVDDAPGSSLCCDVRFPGRDGRSLFRVRKRRSLNDVGSGGNPAC